MNPHQARHEMFDFMQLGESSQSVHAHLLVLYYACLG